jgi:hypothetical protein
VGFGSCGDSIFSFFSFVLIFVNGVFCGESVVIIYWVLRPVEFFILLVSNMNAIYLDYWGLCLIVNVQWYRFPKGVPWIRYHGVYKDLNINLVWPGKDLALGKYMILLCVSLYMCFCVCFTLCFLNFLSNK